MQGPPGGCAVVTTCKLQQSLQDTEAAESLAVPSHHGAPSIFWCSFFRRGSAVQNGTLVCAAY